MAGFSQRFRIESRGKLLRVVNGLLRIPMGEDEVFELIFRTERVEKTHEQRKLFHVVCADIAPLLWYTPGQTKLRIKASFYGVELRDGGSGIYYAVVPSSEDSDREEYSRLIDHAYQYAAEAGVVVPDRRLK